LIWLFLGLNITAFALISYWPSGEELVPPGTALFSQLKEEKDVTLLGRSWVSMVEALDARKVVEAPATIKREKAAELALEHTSDMIKYLFAAAAGFLAFLAKYLIESQGQENRVELPASAIVISVAGALCFLTSMFGGLSAQGWFTQLATQTQFSLVREFAVWVVYQQVFLFLGVVLVLLATIPVVVGSGERRERL